MEDAMRRNVRILGLLLGVAACQQGVEQSEPPATAAESTPAPAPVPGSPEAKIAEALSAAPADIAGGATIMDWPATEGGEMTELRAGGNGWTCFPNSPAAVTAAVDDPMCLDETWLAFANAWMTRTEPQVTKVGFGYMLQGDAGSSATDPFAMSETADNQWVRSGPHMMVVVPDPKALEGLPTTPQSGGPWVMWAGTAWAHIMAPVPAQR
jgi:hypothetical protein